MTVAITHVDLDVGKIQVSAFALRIGAGLRTWGVTCLIYRTVTVTVRKNNDSFMDIYNVVEFKHDPLVMTDIAIENDHVEIVDFPIKHGDVP